MKIETFKDLAKLVDLCRKKGINAITVDGIVLNMGDAPERLNRNAAPEQSDKIQVEPSYTDEELMTWSSAPRG